MRWAQVMTASGPHDADRASGGDPARDDGGATAERDGITSSSRKIQLYLTTKRNKIQVFLIGGER
jgi:hypothetical protein